MRQTRSRSHCAGFHSIVVIRISQDYIKGVTECNTYRDGITGHRDIYAIGMEAGEQYNYGSGLHGGVKERVSDRLKCNKVGSTKKRCRG